MAKKNKQKKPGQWSIDWIDMSSIIMLCLVCFFLFLIKCLCFSLILDENFNFGMRNALLLETCVAAYGLVFIFS